MVSGLENSIVENVMGDEREGKGRQLEKDDLRRRGARAGEQGSVIAEEINQDQSRRCG